MRQKYKVRGKKLQKGPPFGKKLNYFPNNSKIKKVVEQS